MNKILKLALLLTLSTGIGHQSLAMEKRGNRASQHLTDTNDISIYTPLTNRLQTEGLKIQQQRTNGGALSRLQGDIIEMLEGDDENSITKLIDRGLSTFIDQENVMIPSNNINLNSRHNRNSSWRIDLTPGGNISLQNGNKTYAGIKLQTGLSVPTDLIRDIMLLQIKSACSQSQTNTSFSTKKLQTHNNWVDPSKLHTGYKEIYPAIITARNGDENNTTTSISTTTKDKKSKGKKKNTNKFKRR